MGVAAQNRGAILIGKHASEEDEKYRMADDLRRECEIAAECDEFARLAMEYLMAPRGLRALSIERAKTRRGWAIRNMALIAAHCAWVDADHRTQAGRVACVHRAQSAYALLVYALGTWTIPSHISVPRAATT